MSALASILARKRVEVGRRDRRLATFAALASRSEPRAGVIEALRRGAGEPLRVIAEIKRASPSAGPIRPRERGDVEAIARAYEAAGVSAISVIGDRGFDGCVLDVRRAARAVSVPVLFKEFVLAPVQLDVARATGASLVLLLVRALERHELAALVHAAEGRGLVPLVEAAGEHELDAVLASGAKVIGVNARDLGTFTLDVAGAEHALAVIPPDRVALLLSGIRTPDDVRRIASGRADGILVGTELMLAPDPGVRLDRKSVV